ncbi:unnamed protein product [Didymodactylos carnosus]|uniref:Uncharacterized protein n=1 Tax=Didymodactylos carnosus TaxID=1234261 RepID=A0A813QYK8_9BILA|nr:unnamed protein product [Didymodactylos carnosus]CAF1360831.1 unnamed protein product [Didymodactylos carnosus]CAF3558209.1 unnamed protein product [Didymodactylos carnosus]CAF4170854.1 unnamed protein product [Didymodactylos carnosus]
MHFPNNTLGNIASLLARIPSNGLDHKAFCERVCETQIGQVTFNDRALSVSLTKSPDDIHLLDSIEAKIDSNDRNSVTVEADFSWDGSIVQSWDKPKMEEITVLSRQKIEKVRKLVVVPNEKLVEVEQAQEEIIPKRTIEQIRQQILSQRILDI